MAQLTVPSLPTGTHPLAHGAALRNVQFDLKAPLQDDAAWQPVDQVAQLLYGKFVHGGCNCKERIHTTNTHTIHTLYTHSIFHLHQPCHTGGVEKHRCDARLGTYRH